MISVARDLLHLQLDLAVVEQDAVAGVDVVGQRLVLRRDKSRLAQTRPGW